MGPLPYASPGVSWPRSGRHVIELAAWRSRRGGARALREAAGLAARISDRPWRAFWGRGALARIKLAIVGVGNCASSLIQGIHFYREARGDAPAGLLHAEIGGYRPGDLEVVCAFDVD